MEARPLRVIPVHEFLRPRLMDLYESDCIFDKFEVSSSSCSSVAALGASGGAAAGISATPPGGGGEGCSSGSGDMQGVSIITGSYNNTLRVYDVGADVETSIELSKMRPKPPTSRPIPMVGGPMGPPPSGGGPPGGATMGAGADVSMDGSWGADGSGFFGGYGGGGGAPGGLDRIDFGKKLLHCSFHPSEPIIAVAGAANLYIYAG